MKNKKTQQESTVRPFSRVRNGDSFEKRGWVNNTPPSGPRPEAPHGLHPDNVNDNTNNTNNSNNAQQ